MGLTDGELARALLDGMADEGVRFAVLHQSERLQAGEIDSDIDLVVADPPAVVMSRLRVLLARLGLAPILVWPYDAGATRGVFLARADLTEGLQLDLLHDPTGLGKYGIRSAAALAESVSGRWPALAADAETAYRIRKRLLKGPPASVQSLVDGVGDPAAVVAAAARIMTPRAAESVTRALARRSWRARSATPLPIRWRRGWRRLRRPVGAWVHLVNGSEGQADELRRRLARILPRAEARPAGAEWWRQPVITRRRPAVILTWGGTVSGPDVRVAESDLAGQAAHLVAALEARSWRQLGSPSGAGATRG
jgi:hypothetical protein